jgi:hypothetical protein
LSWRASPIVNEAKVRAWHATRALATAPARTFTADEDLSDHEEPYRAAGVTAELAELDRVKAHQQ